MVFKVPDWEDGNDRKNSVFSEKAKGKQKNGLLNKSPQNKTKTTKVNGVSEKSITINKKNKKQLRRQKQKISKNVNNSNSRPEVDITKTKNGLKTKNQNIPEKKSNSPKNQKGNIKNRNLKKDISVSNLKVENFDTDKLDEEILSAKKKKFNEALKKDDIEDLLFKEDKSPEAKNRKPPHKIKQLTLNNSAVKVNGVEKKAKLHKKQLLAEIKPKKLNNNSIIKAKNINKPVIDKEVSKVDDHNENISNKLNVQTHQNKRKNKLKLILQESNRNPINLNRNKLRERMLDRLKSAQFRFLNEKLYTSSGSEASQLFRDDPAAFHTYHEGYQQQVKKWPVNPLDVIVKRIQKMPKTSLIADMGCGEAALSKRVRHTVRSFDLVATAPGVEVCDMAHTPLLTASMDAVVYCLALMGTELTKYLLEANRVLKTGGHLLIAEVESRFTDVNAFTKEVSRLGFKLQKLNSEHEVFFFMEFTKNQEPPVKKAKLPVITLKPCIYKRR